jgi:hypothetical protein
VEKILRESDLSDQTLKSLCRSFLKRRIIRVNELRDETMISKAGVSTLLDYHILMAIADEHGEYFTMDGIALELVCRYYNLDIRDFR